VFLHAALVECFDRKRIRLIRGIDYEPLPRRGGRVDHYRPLPSLTAPYRLFYRSCLPSLVSRLPAQAKYMDFSAPILPAMLMELLQRAVHSAHVPQAEML